MYHRYQTEVGLDRGAAPGRQEISQEAAVKLWLPTSVIIHHTDVSFL